MKNIIRTITIAFVVAGLGLTAASAQKPKKAPDYKISNVTLLPYNEATGKFEDALDSGPNGRSFFNDLSTSLFVTFEVAGERGTFEPGRMINITVREGRKIKQTRRVQVGLIGDSGSYYVPLWIYGSVCEKLTITASLSGQKVLSPVKRTVSFTCGE